MIKIVTLLFLFVVSSFSAITIDKDFKNYDRFTLEYFYDESGSLGIDAISLQDFKQAISNNFTLGYKDGVSWFKIVLKNNTQKEDFILHFSEAIWERVDLYEYKDTQWKIEKNGLSVPINDRTIKDVHPTFKLHIKTNTTKTYYIRGETIASHLGSFELMDQNEYFDLTKINIIDLYIIFSFALFSILLINIYSYFLTKENIYLYYIAYNFIFILFGAMQSGFYLLFGLDGWNEGLHFIGSLVIISLLLFSRKFLSLDQYLPKVDRFFKISLYIFILFSILLLIDPPHVTIIFNLFSTLFFLVLFYAVFRVYTMGYISAKYYLLALMIYAPTMTLMILTFNALIDYNEINRHLFLIGAFLEIIVFTLILASKYRIINKEKIKLQQELIKEKESQEEHLRIEIDKKTNDIQEMLNKFEFATDNALAGYWEVNIDTNIVSFSQGWYNFLGYNPKDMDQKTTQEVLEKIVHKDDLQNVLDAVELYLTHKSDLYDVQFRVLHKTKGYTWVKAVGSIYNNKFFGFHIDVNDIYTINERLAETTKLAAIGEMIANIAHQWRQPLSIIATSATSLQLKNEMDILKDDELNFYCNHINENSQYLSQTIDDFRNFLENNSDPIYFNLNNKVDSFKNLVQTIITKHHIEVFIEIDQKMEIRGYPNEIVQCLMNLLNNSKDAFDENNIPDGERFIFIKGILSKDQKSVLITFKDSARGIPENLLEKVFEPYFTTKHKSIGTGLGLHMSYNLIVKQMGGKFDVKNTNYIFKEKEFRGAEFFIELPVE